MRGSFIPNRSLSGMRAGYWFMFFGLLSFAAMGIIHKLGDRYACNALHIALFTMATSCALSFLNAALWQRESLLSWNARVVLIAWPCVASAAIALWPVELGRRYGRI